MNIRNVLSIVIVSLFLTSCSEKQQQTVKKELDTAGKNISKTIDTVSKKLSPADTIFESVQVKEVKVKSPLSAELNSSLEDVFDHYVDIKEELADNDSVDSRKHALALLETINKASQEIDVPLKKNWNDIGKKFSQYNTLIENSSTLKQQRELFAKLSAAMAGVVEQFGIPGKTIYRLRSDDSPYGKNSIWLTDSKSSEDPYTGGDDGKVVVVDAWEFEKQ